MDEQHTVTPQGVVRVRTITLLGTVAAPGGVLWCHVIGWSYALDPPEYGDEDADRQIIVETRDGNRARAGVSIDLEISEDGDIPIYAEREGRTLRRIVVDATRWVEEGQNLAPPLLDEFDAVLARERVVLLGYVAGHAILITDFHFLRVTGDVVDYDRNQIVDEGTGPPMNVGVYVQLGEQDEGQQYPVYAQYQDDAPVRVIVDLAPPPLG